MIARHLRTHLAASLLALSAACPALLAESVGPLSSAETKWLSDAGREEERELLNSTIGFALPDPPATLGWSGDEGVPTVDEWSGDIVVIQSWTNATPAGRAALRRTERLLRKFRDQPVRLVGLHTPEGVENLNLDKKLPAPTLVDERGAYCDELGIYKRPTTIVVDQRGVIRYPGVSMAGLQKAITSLLENPADPELATPPALPTLVERGLEEAPAELAEFPENTGFPQNARDVRGKTLPDVVVGKYLTGQPDLKNKVIMVEFWATWCGPCIRGIPHLNELQAAFPDELVVIGVSDESEGKVRQFMNRTRMSYTVAVDQQRRMAGFTGHRGIPHAMVVSPDGVVRWQGHPASLNEETLGQIVSASFVQTGPMRWVTEDEG